MTTPYSERFDDVYFSREDGQAEVEHTFLGGNNLPERWLVDEGTKKTFLIGETGFGTGLNIWTTLKHWQQAAKPQGSTLCFYSVEKYPLTAQEHNQLLNQPPFNALPGVSFFVNWLAEHKMVAGENTIQLASDVFLRLWYGDITEALHAWQRCGLVVDAWYLDGFAPAKNPEMWTEDVLAGVAACTVRGGTFATFTAAGHVRRGLEQAGFLVEKKRGYGRKRDMLCGQRAGV